MFITNTQSWIEKLIITSEIWGIDTMHFKRRKITIDETLLTI